MSEHPAEADTVARRLERLERQNRRLRWGVAAVGLAAVAALLFGARPAITQPATVSYATVKARHFVLVDAAGRTRAVLGMRSGVQPGLMLFDAVGKTRALLDLSPGGQPRLRLYDAAGQVRVLLALWPLWPGSQPWLSLFDAAGNNRLVIGSTRQISAKQGGSIGTPIASIMALDKTGHVTARWPHP